jgi:hypothetical protein
MRDESALDFAADFYVSGKFPQKSRLTFLSGGFDNC